MSSSVSRRKVLGTIALTALVGRAAAGAQQPHMQEAKTHLLEAVRHLELASADKGGHRVAAIKATRDAIEHVEKGIRFDRRN